MSLTHQNGDLGVFIKQVNEHLECLAGLTRSSEPPATSAVAKATSATRALRGSASILGLDEFQVFLGRLFQLLADVQSNGVPWSGNLAAVIDTAASAEASFLESLRSGRLEMARRELSRMENELSTWRRNETRRFENANTLAIPSVIPAQQADVVPLPGSCDTNELEKILESLQRVQKRFVRGGAGQSAQAKVEQLVQEVGTLQKVVLDATQQSGEIAQRGEQGLRNHCEGALRHLVDAAAQEVLEEAQERDLRLGIRATGFVDRVDDELGGTLLQILHHLWLDCLEAQASEQNRQVDTVFSVDEGRLRIDIRDPLARRDDLPTPDEDVLGRYAGLRRSRPLIETLQGLVWVEPKDSNGCRFQLSLPCSMESRHATAVRIGAHEVAIPVAAIDRVYGFGEVRINQDQAGAFVEVEGARYPVFNLAFHLNDVSFDEAARDIVVVVGSFERRAALFASGPTHEVEGELVGQAEVPWAGRLVTPHQEMAVLDVGALLGRKSHGANRASSSEGGALSSHRGVVLIVNGSDSERAALKGQLEEVCRRAVVVRDADEAKSVLESQPVDLMVVDLRLPDMNGQQIAEHRRRTGRFADVPMLLLLDQPGEQSNLVAEQLGASDYLETPVTGDELLAVIARLTEGS